MLTKKDNSKKRVKASKIQKSHPPAQPVKATAPAASLRQKPLTSFPQRPTQHNQRKCIRELLKKREA